MERDFEREGLRFEVRGLDSLQPFTDDAHAARKQGLPTARRMTIVADAALEEVLKQNLTELGAMGYASVPCAGPADSVLLESNGYPPSYVRIEVVLSRDVGEEVLVYLRREILPDHPIMAYRETVEMVSFGPSLTVTADANRSREEQRV